MSFDPSRLATTHRADEPQAPREPQVSREPQVPADPARAAAGAPSGPPRSGGSPARPPSKPFQARVDRVNRVVLTLLGLVCLAAGVAALLAGFDAWGGRTAEVPVLTPEERAFATDHGWFWPAVGAAVGLVTLAASTWLVAQAGRGRLPGLRLAVDRTGGLHLDASALTDAVEADAAACPGVRSVGADLLGRPHRPVLRLAVAVDPEADVAALRGCLEGAVLNRARSAVGLADLAVEVNLAPVSRHERRVR